MKKAGIILSLCFTLSAFGNVVHFPHIYELTHADIIGLCEITSVTDSVFIVRIIDPIKGCQTHDELFIKQPEIYSPFRKFPVIGMQEIVFISGYDTSLYLNEECELSIRNDSVIMMPYDFHHGCYFMKYKQGIESMLTQKATAYAYTDFKSGILDYLKKEDKVYKLVLKEKSVVALKKEIDKKGYYSAKDGTPPIFINRRLLKFISRSKFHERIIDGIVDFHIT